MPWVQIRAVWASCIVVGTPSFSVEKKTESEKNISGGRRFAQCLVGDGYTSLDMQLVCFYPNDEVVPLGKDSEAAVTSKFLVIVDPPQSYSASFFQ